MDVVITSKGVLYKNNYSSEESWSKRDKADPEGLRHKKVSEDYVDYFVLAGLDTKLPESTDDILKDFDSWKDQNPGYNSSHLRQSVRRLFEAKLIEEYRN